MKKNIFLLLLTLALPSYASADIARLEDPIPVLPEAQRAYTSNALELLQATIESSPSQDTCSAVRDMLRLQTHALAAHQRLLANLERDDTLEERLYLTHLIGLTAVRVRSLSQRQCPGQATTLAQLPRSERRAFDRVFHESKGAVARCKRRAEHRDGTQHGKLDVRLVVGPRGRVSHITSDASYGISSTLTTCIEQLFEGLEFPATQQDVQLEHSWVLGQ